MELAVIGRFFGKPSPEEIVREHGPAVSRLLARMLGPRVQLEDVFQNVFLEVLRSLPRFEGRASLATWIHRITINVAYQEMRLRYSQRGMVPLEEADEPSSVENAESDLLRAERLTLIYDALEMIEPKRRIAVILHDIEGLPLREIAVQVGRPLQTVNSQLKAGRAEVAELVRQRHHARGLGKAGSR